MVHVRVLYSIDMRSSANAFRARLPQRDRFARRALVLRVPCGCVYHGRARNRKYSSFANDSRVAACYAGSENAQVRPLQFRPPGT